MSVDVEGVQVVAQPGARALDGYLVERHALVADGAGGAAGQVDLDRCQHPTATERRCCVAATQQGLVDIVMQDLASPVEVVPAQVA